MITRAYIAGAAGLFIAGQQASSTVGDRLLDQAMTAGDGIGGVIDEAAKLATLGISQTDAAIIVAIAGVAWKFLDGQQKGGTFETFNLWLRRKLKVGDHNPPAPPVK